MDFSNDGKYLLTCGLDGGVRLWLTDLGRCVVNYRSFSTPAWCVRFSPKTVVFVSVQKEELCTCTIRTISSMQDALLLH